MRKRLAERVELHYAPKHGGWLNIARGRVERSWRQCTNCRLASIADLAAAVAWTIERNASQKEIGWRFTTEHARIKLKHLYPSL